MLHLSGFRSPNLGDGTVRPRLPSRLHCAVASAGDHLSAVPAGVVVIRVSSLSGVKDALVTLFYDNPSLRRDVTGALERLDALLNVYRGTYRL